MEDRNRKDKDMRTAYPGLVLSSAELRYRPESADPDVVQCPCDFIAILKSSKEILYSSKRNSKKKKMLNRKATLAVGVEICIALGSTMELLRFSIALTSSSGITRCRAYR